MAQLKYFADIDGQAIELVSGITTMNNVWFDRKYPGVKAIRSDSFSKRCGRAADGRILPVTRIIEYKARPSLHECNAKCLNGKHNGKCECLCGGKNHGAGMFTKLVAA